ncbi:hypothetical protein [Thalassotalea sp. PS06]|uniref:hypothetical protein n=1 Tax=Thalassotalea sp. PS06 TaxID=2594005 RepID=UPI0011655D43|nr:hypothetical protein [Thalassotalea sp. PS06]QDP01681.1 hypothetical protein FNC98_10250 [Thalassotalea sp. PS06]
MTRLLVLCFAFISVNVIAIDVPETINIKGSFQFDMLDSSGNLMLGNYIESASDITSASVCHLSVSAYDDYYFTYPVDITLQKDGDILIPSIALKALYIDENSNYRIKDVKNVNYKVADLEVNESNWEKLIIKKNTILFDKTVEQGLLAYHHLTLGQPLRVELIKEEKPYSVTIDVAPLSQKTARLARKCLELVDL